MNKRWIRRFMTVLSDNNMFNGIECNETLTLPTCQGKRMTVPESYLQRVRFRSVKQPNCLYTIPGLLKLILFDWLTQTIVYQSLNTQHIFNVYHAPLFVKNNTNKFKVIT